MTVLIHYTRRWLHDLHVGLSRDEARIHATAGLGLTGGRILVLASERPGIIVTRAGLWACVSRSQASRVTRDLEERGLVSTRGTPSDGRVLRIFPTPEGRRVAEHLSFLLQYRMYAVLMDLPEEELESFGSTLLHLKGAVAELDPPRRRRFRGGGSTTPGALLRSGQPVR